jgi:hypothetical protein
VLSELRALLGLHASSASASRSCRVHAPQGHSGYRAATHAGLAACRGLQELSAHSGCGASTKRHLLVASAHAPCRVQTAGSALQVVLVALRGGEGEGAEAICADAAMIRALGSARRMGAPPPAAALQPVFEGLLHCCWQRQQQQHAPSTGSRLDASWGCRSNNNVHSIGTSAATVCKVAYMHCSNLDNACPTELDS